MYFVDFDRTMFDYDRFILELKGQEKGHTLRDLPREQIAPELTRLITEGALAFEPGELAPYLYPDSAEFLRAKENSAMIITFGSPVRQRAKIKSATHGIARVQVICTDLKRKGEFLAPNIALYGQNPVFVDDLPLELELMGQYCPTMQLYEMRRDGEAGDGRWPVIRSLSELP